MSSALGLTDSGGITFKNGCIARIVLLSRSSIKCIIPHPLMWAWNGPIENFMIIHGLILAPCFFAVYSYRRGSRKQEMVWADITKPLGHIFVKMVRRFHVLSQLIGGLKWPQSYSPQARLNLLP